MQFNLPPYRRSKNNASTSLVRATPKTTDTPVSGASGQFRNDSASSGIDPTEARDFSDTVPYVNTAISRIKLRVARAERGIFPIYPNKPYDQKLQADLTYLLENPNPKGESWRTFSEPIVKDYLTLGKGGWEYVQNFRGWPLALFGLDTRYLAVQAAWDGRDPKAPRYRWKKSGQAEILLRSDQITLMLDDPSTHRPEGWSKLAVLKSTLESLSATDEYIRSLLQKYLPPGWIDLGKSATARDVKAVSNKLNQDVLGRGGMLITGNLDNPQYTNLWAGGSRELELQLWEQFFGRLVAVVFGLSPMDLGLTSDLNKASAGVQQDVSGEDGAISVLSFIEEMWNREVIGKYGTPETVNLALRFKDVTWAERERRAKMVSVLSANMPVYQMNELRDLSYLGPIDGGNAIWFPTRLGPVPVLGQDAASYVVSTQEDIADNEDAGAKSGAKTVVKPKPKSDDGDAVAPPPPEQESNAGNKAPSGTGTTQAHRDVVEPLLAAYLRMWSGTADWQLTLDAPTAHDMQQFMVAMVTRPQELTPRELSRAAQHREKLLHHLAAPTEQVPAYAVAEQCSAAFAQAA